ncbi:unnamed protein product, partial [Callosobruchus maculatus]
MKLPEHECTLHHDTNDVLKQVIDTGIFITLRRKWHSLIMLSQKHPLTASRYKSGALCRREQMRHILTHKYIISPFSMFWLYWEFFMFFVYLVRFIAISICASFNWEDSGKRFSVIVIARVILDLLTYIDIFKIFCSGYYDSLNNITVLKPGLIARRYLKFYFWVDILSSLTAITYPMKVMLEDSIAMDVVCDTTCLFALAIILRLPRWSYAMEMFRRYVNLSSYLFKATKSFLAYLMVLCWLFTTIMDLNNLVHNYFYNEIIRTFKLRRFFSITLVLLHVSNGADPQTTVIDTIISTFFLCVGFCMQMYLYGK